MAPRVNSIGLDVAVRRLFAVPGDHPTGCCVGVAGQAGEQR